MKKTSTPIVVAMCLLIAGTAFAQDRTAHPTPTPEQATRFGWATVLRSDPVYAQGEETAAAQDDCRAEQASPPPRSEPADNRVGGTVAGAVIGAVVGNLFGRGDGRVATTAAGAVAGGVIGNQVAAAGDMRAVQSGGEVDVLAAASERRCPQPQKRIVAYDVEYRYAGELYIARLAYDPGDRMRVKISVVPAD